MSQETKKYTIEQPRVQDAEELTVTHNQYWEDTYPSEAHRRELGQSKLKGDHDEI